MECSNKLREEEEVVVEEEEDEEEDEERTRGQKGNREKQKIKEDLPSNLKLTSRDNESQQR
jgi:hypothetical protein